jgi:hypothetical protein
MPDICRSRRCPQGRLKTKAAKMPSNREMRTVLDWEWVVPGMSPGGVIPAITARERRSERYRPKRLMSGFTIAWFFGSGENVVNSPAVRS